MIDHATVEKIKNTADIVEVVSDYVHLIRRGANYMGLCPFHNERTPSFSVNKQRNFCYCFSCKKGGSPVNFIMEKEGLSYHEALLHLAKKYGIEVVERELTDEERERQSAREAMFVANEWAMRKMEDDMRNTEEGRDIGLQYFTQRGVTDEAVKAFHLGYALDRGNALTDAARKAGFNLDILKSLGLVGTSQQGREYDRFRGRVIFPILNTAGKVIAFGGRDLKGGLAKYINSPESELYKKSNELYGIFQAKSSIVSNNKCFLVEGYMDVIGMWQSGMKNVVASSGTALTDGQIAMIHRFTENITLIYDGDAAGIKASLRGIDMLLSHRLNVKVLLLPDGDDPDSFARKHTPDEFKEYVAAHETDIIRYKAQVMLNEVKKDPQNRINAINSVVGSIAHIPDQVARDVYVQECSDILGIPETTISKAVAKARMALVEQMKRDRLRKSYGDTQPARSSQFPPSAPSAQNTQPTQSAQSAQTAQTAQSAQFVQPAHPSQALQSTQQTDQSAGTLQQPSQSQQTVRTQQVDYGQQQTPRRSQSIIEQVYPLYPLEQAVIKYCVRYAYLPFCTYEEMPENSDNESQGSPRLVTLDVVDFVYEELQDSQLDFTVPIFKEIFKELLDLKTEFNRFLSEKNVEIEREAKRMEMEGIQQIRESDMSVVEIKNAEKKLEEKINEMKISSLREYAKDYPCRILGSHENSEIRTTVMNLVFEKHHLSNIYLKNGNTELEEDRLNVLLVRAIDEWKNEIVNLRIKELFGRFREISGKGDTEEEERLQQEINNLMQLRTQMAKCIGERIISTTR